MNRAIKERNGALIRLKDVKPIDKGRLIYDRQANPAIDAMDMNQRLQHVDAAYDYLLGNPNEKMSFGDKALILLGVGWFSGLLTMYGVITYLGII